MAFCMSYSGIGRQIGNILPCFFYLYPCFDTYKYCINRIFMHKEEENLANEGGREGYG